MDYKRDIINVSIVNFKISTGNNELNLSRIKDYTIEAAKRGADIVVFPELCLTGYDYFSNNEISLVQKILASEFIDGPCCSELEKITKMHRIYLVFGMSELIGNSDLLYNSAVAIGPQGVIGSYQKMHLNEDESTWFTKGDRPFAFDTEWGPVSIGIGHDGFQSPELIKQYVDKGSRLYLNPSIDLKHATDAGSREEFIERLKTKLEAAALANSIYIARANLAGYDDMKCFSEGSMIIGPMANEPAYVDAAPQSDDDSDSQIGLRTARIDLSLAGIYKE